MAIQYGVWAQDEVPNGSLDLYEVPAATTFVGTLNLVNTSANDVEVWIALSDTDTPTASEWIEHLTLLGTATEGGGLERTGITLQAGKHIVITGSAAGVTAAVWGQIIT